LTLNTDFSATEVDDRQVNLTRFSLFFPEKRDFFLRDVDIFEFGQIGSGGFNNQSGTGSAAITTPARQNGRPFFSRRVGLSPTGESIDLDAGAKLSGRMGDWNLGTLVIRQGESPSLDAQDVVVGRVVRNVGSRMQVGAIVTDGNPQADLDNSLVGADIRYRNTNFHGNTIELSSYYHETDTEGSTNDNNASYGINFFLPNSQGWQALYQYKRVERDFFPAPRVHLTRFHGVFAAHAALRSAITPGGRGAGAARRAASLERPAPQAVRMTWARRLKRVFGIQIEQCVRCGGRLKVLASIEEPELIERILAHRRERGEEEAPTAPLGARAPPQASLF